MGLFKKNNQVDDEAHSANSVAIEDIEEDGTSNKRFAMAKIDTQQKKGTTFRVAAMAVRATGVLEQRLPSTRLRIFQSGGSGGGTGGRGAGQGAGGRLGVLVEEHAGTLTTSRGKRRHAKDVKPNNTSRQKELERIRQMPAKLAVKRKLREELLLQPLKDINTFTQFKQKLKLNVAKFKRDFHEFSSSLVVWSKSLKEIEGQQGSGVASYFIFLRWLLFLDVLIFLLLFLFLTLPTAIYPVQGYRHWVTGSQGNVTVYNTTVADQCSANYTVNIKYQDAGQLILDFLQGTGWLEKTALFYGNYPNRELGLGEFSGSAHYYNLPLAYMVITIIYLSISLVAMVRSAGEGVREEMVDSQDSYGQYCYLVFSGWDCTLEDNNSAYLKHRSIYSDIKANLDEEKDKLRRSNRSTRDKVKLYSVRLLINVVVIATLGATGYVIYLAQQYTNQNLQADSLSNVEQLFFQYLPSLSMTVLNFIIPFIFRQLVKLEDYSRVFQIQLTLGRTICVRLASLAMLLAKMFVDVLCQYKNDCNVGIQGCTPLQCWETFIGQQLYKLVILDFFVTTLKVFLVEFPKGYIFRRRKRPLPEFEISGNILDLIYGQSICWLGAFFSPLIPGICVFKFFFFFYLKKLTVLRNCNPPTKPYRASKSNTFFLLYLLFTFILVCIPIGYAIAQLSPSKGCGPFRLYTHMWQILAIQVYYWPKALQDIWTAITSSGVVVASFVFLWMIMYYSTNLASARKEMIAVLHQQLVLEAKDKQFLLRQMNEDLTEQQESHRDPDYTPAIPAAGAPTSQHNRNYQSHLLSTETV